MVGEYNGALETGALQRLSPPRRNDPIRAWPIKAAPFYAMPICAAITNTMGGIVVDGNARVLDVNDRPIPGSTPPARRSADSMAARTPATSAG